MIAAAAPASKFSVRAISLLLITILLAQSAFAAPEAASYAFISLGEIGREAKSTWQKTDLSRYLNVESPAPLAALVSTKGKSKASVEFDRITINQLDTTISQGESLDFVATAYRGEQPVAGVLFKWTIRKAESGESRSLLNGRYKASLPGNFIVRVTSGGFFTETTLTVRADPEYNITRLLRKPEIERTPIEQKQIASWIASGLLTTRNVSSRDPIPVAVGGVRGNRKVKAPRLPDNETADNSRPVANRPTSADPIGWDNSNYSAADEPNNWVGRPPGGGTMKGAATGNYNLTIPIVNLDGRGVDINLNLEYNSRLWSEVSNEMTYNPDSGYPAPGWNLGFGRMFHMGTNGGCMLLAPDGTRRPYNGTLTDYGSGANVSQLFDGYTIDGSLINFSCYYSSGSYGNSLSGTARFPDGTVMTFGGPSANYDQVFPIRIQDAHGNYVNVSYVSSQGPEISSITDTLGRTISFTYSSGRLSTITGPGYNGTTRTFANFQHVQKTLGYNFASGYTTSIANSSPYLLEAVYFPTTNTGYWFGETDSYSTYGMIARIREKRGMAWSGGAVTSSGTTTRDETYNFPMNTSGSPLTDPPGYSTYTETFDGIDTSSLVSTYSVSTSGTTETITRTLPDGSRRIEESDTAANGGKNLKSIVKEPSPSNVELDKTVLTFESGYNGSSRIKYIDHTDDKSQTTRKELTYGTNYNQVTAQKEFDYGSTLYREKRFTYENNSGYTSRNLVNLVKSVEDYDNSNGRLTRTVFTYDYYGLEAASGIVQHDFTHDPHTTETVNGTTCAVWYPNGVGCEYDGQWVLYNGNYVNCACETWDQVSAFDSTTGARGNLTNVTTYTDGAGATGAITYDYVYDIAGNQRTATTNCCQQIGSSYSTATQYLLPDSVTKGSSNPSSPDRITQSFTYDTNTKVLTEEVDFNGNDTDIVYDAVLRPTLVTLNSGAKKTITYNDSSLNQNELVQKSTGEGSGTVSNSTVYFNGRGQPIKSTYQAGASNHNATSFQYDDILRKRKVSRPYDSASSPSYWSTTEYDILGRAISQTAPDTASVTTMTYNGSAPSSASSNVGQTVTSSDAWGRERWVRYDAFGRLAEAVEPNPAGSDGDVNAGSNINTTYTYDRLDRLTTITQGDQTRSFAYDSLGRLTNQKLPEQHASLSNTGTYMSSGGTWSDYFEYDSRSNLKKRVDARGVTTTYEYNVSSSPDPLNRLQSISYSTSGADTTYTIHAAPTVTFEYMTTGDKSRVKKVTTSGVATEENTFDGEGRVSSYQLKLDAHTGKPFTTDYTYDSAHRITEIEYPKRYQMTYEGEAEVVPSYDQASRLTQMTVDASTYLSDVSYNTSSQVTSLKTGSATSHPRVESYAYDAATGLLTGQTVKNVALSTTYLDLTYSYDRLLSAGSSSGKTGQMTKVQNNLIDDRDRKYEFDALGRLKYAKGGTAAGATATANWTQTYTYDRYGNKTATAVSGNSDENGNPVPADGITSTATDTYTNRISAFTYDRAGNIVRGQNASGTWQRYEYDAGGRLKEVQDDSYNDLETYKYGAGRQKLVMTNSSDTFYYVWGGSSIIAEYKLSGGNPLYLKSYIYAGSRLLMTFTRVTSSTQKEESHHPDRLGTKLVTDMYGGTSYQQSTLPFGTAFGAESSGYSNQVFTSYDRSAGTGLDYANNRTYSSGQGRFTQVDPIAMAAASIGNPQSNNLYAYTQNMPTDFVDPSGLQMIAFTRTICLPWDGGPRICFEVVVHWMNTGGSSGSTTSGGGGGGGRGDCDKLIPNGPATASVLANIKATQNKINELNAQALKDAKNVSATGVPLDAGAAGAVHGINTFGGPLDRWFESMVADSQPWDYKKDNPAWEDFGNFNYGAVGAAAGISLGALERMAGWVQPPASPGVYPAGIKPATKVQARAGIGGEWPYGDEFHDNRNIRNGFAYFDCVRRQGLL